MAPAAQMITTSSSIELGLVVLMATGLLALGGWSAILRHRQDDHGHKIRRIERRTVVLEDDKTARDAVKAYKRGVAPDAPRTRPADSSSPSE
ncbi:unnamed protein product [marine sediment metagenome]|uniref:Uncharacterized protein n=1 Tax=marine sediment metagenome TaxID=412755 RepID=X0W3R4_9ZZZZ